eukprot:scaffold86193_cov24-Tisochrysis_lutea.AAC.2
MLATAPMTDSNPNACLSSLCVSSLRCVCRGPRCSQQRLCLESMSSACLSLLCCMPLQSVVPCRFRADKQLVSHDTHNNTYNYKYTFSVEIAPVCKNVHVLVASQINQDVHVLGDLQISECTCAGGTTGCLAGIM